MKCWTKSTKSAIEIPFLLWIIIQLIVKPQSWRMSRFKCWPYIFFLQGMYRCPWVEYTHTWKIQQIDTRLQFGGAQQMICHFFHSTASQTTLSRHRKVWACKTWPIAKNNDSPQKATIEQIVSAAAFSTRLTLPLTCCCISSHWPLEAVQNKCLSSATYRTHIHPSPRSGPFPAQYAISFCIKFLFFFFNCNERIPCLRPKG